MIQQAARDGTPVHEVERFLWTWCLRIGFLGLQQFFALLGTGDVGDTLDLPDGQTARRLEHPHARRYVSVFGEFRLERTAYGSREGQAIACMPLDNRLQLPESPFSYLEKNAGRMRYDEYLSKGYPIASGVIEGACRHLVKDRMERAGMRWTMVGAQAMRDVRSVYVNDAWEEYQAYRIERETERLYPNRSLFTGVNFPLAV